MTLSRKPIGEMTAAEVEAWQRAMLQDGIDPQPVAYPAAGDGSSARYDRALNAVVETLADGTEYLLSLRDGKLARTPLARPPQLAPASLPKEWR